VPWVRGVVGWVDLTRADAAGDISELARDPLLKGVRTMLQDLDGDAAATLATPALAALATAGWRLDLLVRPRHLRAIRALQDAVPSLPLVIDHGAKPAIAGGDLAGWDTDLRAVAAHPETFCKLSGLVAEAGPGWTIERLRPVVDTILAAFGPARVMWGSDWPVVNAGASYDLWDAATADLLAGWSSEDRARILGGTATAFYGLAA